MDNMSDYLKWYGEFSFEEKPLTEVDNFILCKLAYLIMSEIEFESKRTFREVVRELQTRCGIHGTFYGKEFIVLQAAESKRYGEIKISHHEDMHDISLSAQFSATSFDLTDELRFVAYRGTDDTMAGWKEDFMISFTETEAQKRALEYLRKALDDKRKIIVAGHSKGANLALYAAVHIEEELQDRISFVYMNDGPGLCPEVCDKNLVSRIKDKSLRFMPEYSVFGKLFEETEIPGIIVKSLEEGIMQHDLFSWGVNHGKADVIQNHSPGSIFINQVLDQWIESVNDSKRVSFVNNLFNSIERSGITTTTQIAEKGPLAIEKILIELLSLDKKTVKTFMKLPLAAAIDEAPDEEKAKKIKDNIKKREWLPYVGMIITSIVLFIIPEYTLQVGISVILFAGILFEIGVTIRHLIRAKWNLQSESARVNICIAMIGMYAMLLVKEDALFIIGSVVIGASFLAWAYRNAIAYKNLCEKTEPKERQGEKLKLIIEIVLLVILGGFILVAPKDTLEWYMIFLGQILLADGVINLLFIFNRIFTPKRTI